VKSCLFFMLLIGLAKLTLAADPLGLTIYREGNADRVLLRWESVPGANRYDVYAGETVGGSYGLSASIAAQEIRDDGLQTSRFFYVQAMNGATLLASSDTVGYFAFTALPYAAGQPGFTPFGLPLTFLDVDGNNVPQACVVSTRPSDILDEQTNCAGGLSVEMVVRQDNGMTAFRNTNASCAWTGALETSAAMIPGRAYWIRNRTSNPRLIVLAGRISPCDSTTAIVPPMAIGTGYNPISWRVQSPVSRHQLGLLAAGFSGTNPANSDRVVDQHTGQLFYRTARGFGGSLQTVQPATAYWLFSHAGGWTYGFELGEE